MGPDKESFFFMLPFKLRGRGLVGQKSQHDETGKHGEHGDDGELDPEA
jgi:hypothetical protein